MQFTLMIMSLALVAKIPAEVSGSGGNFAAENKTRGNKMVLTPSGEGKGRKKSGCFVGT